jgi:integrase
MAQTINRLTDKTIRAIKEPGLYHDGGGLYLQVTGNSGTAKNWVLRYSLRNKAHGMGLGSYRHLTLAQARAERDKYQAMLRDHIDPLLHRAQQRAANVRQQTSSIAFREAVEQCVPIFTQELTNQKHIAQWTSSLRDHALPVLGGMMVRDITAHDVLRCLEPIWKDKGTTASRVRSRIEKVLDWARVHGFCSGDNPARWDGNLELMLGKRRDVQHHKALAYTELPAFMAKLRQQDGVAARALEFAILTCARTGEVALAEPNEIDAKEKLWTVPASHMKLRRTHLVPLSKRALELAEGAKAKDNKLLFDFHEGALLVVLEKMGYGHVTVHGFRAAFKSWATDKTSFENYVSESALAHASGDKTEQAYTRTTFLAKRRRLMDAWAAWCDGKGITEQHDNLVQLPAR